MIQGKRRLMSGQKKPLFRARFGRRAKRVRNPTPMSVVNLSKALQVHPAIVAGKVRYEQRNYRLLSHFVGTGEVRRQLGLAA